MKKRRFWPLYILCSIFLVGMVWQVGRFANLSAEAGELERTQESWISRNRKLEAEIALLSSRERTAEMAEKLGLKRAEPEDRLRIVVKPAAGGTSGGEATFPGGKEGGND